MTLSLQYTNITVNDVDEALGFYRDALGLEVLQEPVDLPWGPRDCAFRDPSGNTVRVNQG